MTSHLNRNSALSAAQRAAGQSVIAPCLQTIVALPFLIPLRAGLTGANRKHLGRGFYVLRFVNG